MSPPALSLILLLSCTVLHSLINGHHFGLIEEVADSLTLWFMFVSSDVLII